MQGLYHMLVEEQKYLEKIIDKLRKELLTAPEGWRLCSFVLTGNSRAFFCKDPDVISVACQIIHITFPFYSNLFHYGIDRECGKRLKKDLPVHGSNGISDDLAASNVLFSALLQKE